MVEELNEWEANAMRNISELGTPIAVLHPLESDEEQVVTKLVHEMQCVQRLIELGLLEDLSEKEPFDKQIVEIKAKHNRTVTIVQTTKVGQAMFEEAESRKVN